MKMYETVAEMLKDRRRWCKNVLAMDEDGLALDSGKDNAAVKWCLLGALERVYPDSKTYWKQLYKLQKVVGHNKIDKFNDDSTHTKILDACKKAKV